MTKLRHNSERNFAGRQRQHDLTENTELTHVGPDTHGGEYLRRFWQPIALSSELGELPRAVRLLGEDLILFRTGQGELGLLDRQCCHRGTSLEYGIVTDEGISCCYHGWLYSVDGTILETPNDPTSRIKEQLRSTAYPTHEYKGIIFAYMGPPAEVPEFPLFDTCEDPGTEYIPYSLHFPCNWLQVLENAEDPVHTVFLHARTSGPQFAQYHSEMGAFDFVETPIGVTSVHTRRWKDKVLVRTIEVILPNISQGAAIWEAAEEEKCFQRTSGLSWKVAVDDTNTNIIGWRHFNDIVDPDQRGDRNHIGKEMVDSYGQYDDERSYDQRQREPGDFEAIVGQRPIAIHPLENLQGSDRGVALLRRLVHRGIQAVKNGKPFVQPSRNGMKTIPTYTQDTIVSIAPSKGDETKLLHEVGEKIAHVILESAQFDTDERQRAFERMIQEVSF
jgi:nitrite reductase/ring-hydroxylating ferredoxin subunit